MLRSDFHLSASLPSIIPSLRSVSYLALFFPPSLLLPQVYLKVFFIRTALSIKAAGCVVSPLVIHIYLFSNTHVGIFTFQHFIFLVYIFSSCLQNLCRH